MSTGKRIYFDYGCFGPMDKDVQDAVLHWIRCQNTHGPRARTPLSYFFEGSSNSTLANWPGIEPALQYFGEALNVSAESILTTQNTTTALLNSVELLTSVRGHKNVVISCSEHPVVRDSLKRLSKRGELNVVEISSRTPDDLFDYKLFSDELKKLDLAEPPIIVISHVLWDTGEVIDLRKALARLNDCSVVADGAHAFGQISLASVPWNIVDCYCTCGHKWVRGPISLGLLLINDDELRDRYLDAFDVSFLTYPHGARIDSERFFASVPIEKFVGTALAIRNMNLLGIDSIRKKTLKLRELLVSRVCSGLVTPLPHGTETGIVSINLRDSQAASEVVTILDKKYKLMVSETTPGRIRICLSSTLSQECVERLGRALAELGLGSEHIALE